jgi:hypothetical protein
MVRILCICMYIRVYMYIKTSFFKCQHFTSNSFLKILYDSHAAIIIIIIIIESRNFNFLKYSLKQNLNNIIIPSNLMKIIEFVQNL